MSWIETVLNATNPEAVVLSCGVNDILFTQDVQGTVDSLQNVWNILDAYESGIVLLFAKFVHKKKQKRSDF